MIHVKRFILFLFLLICAQQNYGQTVLLHVNEETAERFTERGPNTKKYSHAFFKFGFVLPPDEDGARIVYGTSVSFAFGMRKKYKIGSVYSLGWEFQTEFTDFKLKQDSGKVFSSTELYDVQRLDITSFCLGFFNRFNFDPKRGNYMGVFLDLGINAKFAFSMSEVQKFKVDHGNATVKIHNLDYTNNVHSDVFARIGFNRFGFWASYRLTDILKPSFNYPQLPRMCAGFEIGLF